jgi:hypothetical protein
MLNPFPPICQARESRPEVPVAKKGSREVRQGGEAEKGADQPISTSPSGGGCGSNKFMPPSLPSRTSRDIIRFPLDSCDFSRSTVSEFAVVKIAHLIPPLSQQR